jgi:hypothetical protein
VSASENAYEQGGKPSTQKSRTQHGQPFGFGFLRTAERFFGREGVERYVRLSDNHADAVSRKADVHWAEVDRLNVYHCGTMVRCSFGETVEC